MEIPWDRLNPDTLRRLIEEFVTRDGTDYGSAEISLERKVDQVILQLRRRQAFLYFDPDSESCQILPAGHVSLDSSPRGKRRVEAPEDSP